MDYDARITFLEKKNPSYGKLVKAEVMIIGVGVEVVEPNTMATWTPGAGTGSFCHDWHLAQVLPGHLDEALQRVARVVGLGSNQA